MSQFTHKYIVPLLYTILWGIGILLCGREMASSNVILSHIKYSNFFVAVFYIYVVFLLECLVGLFDKAIDNLKAQFNVNLIFLLCMILLDISFTLWLSFLFIFENEESAACFVGVIVLMLCLKLMSSWFSNKVDKFVVKIHIDTIQSAFHL